MSKDIVHAFLYSPHTKLGTVVSHSGVPYQITPLLFLYSFNITGTTVIEGQKLVLCEVKMCAERDSRRCSVFMSHSAYNRCSGSGIPRDITPLLFS